MIKYRVLGHWDKIEPVEIIKETDKQAVIVEIGFDGKGRERRVSTAGADTYHETWKQAHELLVKRAETRVENAKMNLERAKGTLGQIKGMKQP